MTPLEYYQKKIAAGEILPDPQQYLVMARFDQLHQQLLAPSQRSFWPWCQKKPFRGLYLWGSVGIGKTFLVDTFYYTLPFPEKQRVHFYAFMRQIHEELRTLQGTKNPLRHIAQVWAKQTRVLCLDELIIHDIADALLLGNLLRALIDAGICVIFTANVPPDDLYRNGIQRHLFLPTIAYFKRHLDVIELNVAEDYRTNYGREKRYYHYPLTVENEARMAADFAFFSKGVSPIETPLIICHRKIRVKKYADGVAWFDFLDICNIPRSQEDYLAIVAQFHTILVSGLVAIAANNHDLARSFIRFIDVLYDAKTRLIITADQPIEQIYTAGPLLFEFARTRSRLTQMQGLQWGSEE